MERRDGKWRFFHPDGSELTAPSPQLGGDPVAALTAAQAELHLTPDSLRPTWDGGPVDLDWAAQTLHHLEALAH